MLVKLAIVVIGGIVTFVLTYEKYNDIKVVWFFMLFGIGAVIAGAAYSALFGKNFVDVVLLEDTFAVGRVAVAGYAFIVAGILLFIYRLWHRKE